MKKPLLSEMTLREKIGQCLLPHQFYIYNIYDEDGNKTKRPTAEQKALLEKEQFGTIYGEQVRYMHLADEHDNKERVINLAEVSPKVNSAEYKKFIEGQCRSYKIPPLVAGDSEHGTGHVFSDLSLVCDAPCIGSADSEELAYELGACIARELRCAGQNWRWSPVVDLTSYRSSGTIRTFANDYPDRTTRLALAHIRGMQDEGVAATAKHFPGADRIEYRDTHFCKAMNASTMEEWWAEQGKVFQDLIDGGVYSIMIGHKAFPAADNTMINGVPIPCTLSKKVITDLLKEEMGFDGVVITDGIQMASLFTLMEYEELIVGLINAGNDVILGALPSSGDILEQAVKDGRVPESRIDDACTRVLNMKEKLGIFNDNYYDLPYKAEDVVPHTKEVSLELARKGLVLVRDRQNLLPFKKENIKNITIICSTHHDPFLDNLAVLKQELESKGANVKIQRRLASEDELKKISAGSDLIIYAVYVDGHRPAGALSLFGEEAFTYFHAFTSGREKSIGVSMGYPYIHYDIMENADTFINTHSKSPESMKALAEAIFGEIPFAGNSPISLIPKPMSAQIRALGGNC